MPKFKLVSEHVNEDFEVEFRTTAEFEVEHLDEVLLHIDMFLKGVGYVYDGELGVGESTLYAATPLGEEVAKHGCCGGGCFNEIQEHSDHYYDINRNR